jgi:hypothetical protein
LSASHFPIHDIGLIPILLSFSVTAVEELGAFVASLAWSLKSKVEGSELAEEARLDVRLPTWPGCLKMPKLSDFLCGWMLQDMVWSDRTLTQRTR